MLRKDITSDVVRMVQDIHNTEGVQRTTIRKCIEINPELTRYNVIEIIEGNYNDLEEVLHELNDEVQSVQRYEIAEDGEDKFYLLTHKSLNKTFKLDVKLVDDIFKSYSKHGLNLSGEEILIKYKLKPEVFGLIKNRLRLYKASDVISEYTKENATEEELEQIIDEVTDENINRAKQKLVDTHEKKFKIEARKAFKKVGNFDYQMDKLREIISEYEPRKVNFANAGLPKNGQATFVISDLHIAKEGTAEIIKRLGFIKQDILNCTEGNIDIILLGDLGEAFNVGGMHPNQIENMDGPFGFDLVMYIVDIMTSFIQDIQAKKNITFTAVTGNHGRFSKLNGDDPERTAELVIYELLKKSLPGVDFEYSRKDWNTKVLNNIGYIYHHGDNGATNKKTSDIIMENKIASEHKIVLMGDKHHLYMKNESDGVIRVICPALAGKGEYDTRLGISSYPGYLKIIKNQFGIPEVYPKYLK